MDNPVEVILGTARGVILLCDHASNAIPTRYGALGLPPGQLERHIAYDIGAAGVTRIMAARLGCTAVLSRFSRLLIDPNRGEDDPTLIMRISDGAVIPGNAEMTEAERRERLALFYAPYHAAVSAAIDASLAAGVSPVLVSLHSFTPVWRGMARPWHAGVLWDADDRLARPMIDAMRAWGDVEVGDNEPYSGQLHGDCMHRHGTSRGLAHALIELRQDLIADEAGQLIWGERLADLIYRVVKTPRLDALHPRCD
ncbi:MAG: N-formylglutamate amidohydrolase [Hyphomicrobiales bacterium]|nr:N-formylglutamate amidohydrolase [Hyphomicrobiales bacterium]